MNAGPDRQVTIDVVTDFDDAPRSTSDGLRQTAQLNHYLHGADKERLRDAATELEALEDIVSAMYLYIDWRHVTKQLTTPQKEHLADAIDRSARRLMGDEASTVDRWWRDETTGA